MNFFQYFIPTLPAVNLKLNVAVFYAFVQELELETNIKMLTKTVRDNEEKQVCCDGECEKTCIMYMLHVY